MIDRLYELLARIGFHDPIHAMLVHVPISLVAGAFAFLLVAVILRRPSLIPTARHASILAFVFVFPTILSGAFDWLHFYRGAMMQPILMKMILAGSVLVILGTGVILGAEVRFRSGAMMLLYALAFVGVVGLGYFGGRLVYGRTPAPATPSANPAGEALFTGHCVGCHRNGGNSVVAAKPLKASKLLGDREQFIRFIRNPTGGMPKVTPQDLSDGQAGSLFEYLSAMRAEWR